MHFVANHIDEYMKEEIVYDINIYIYIKHEIEYMKNRTFVGVFVKYVKKQSLYLGDFYPWIS